MRNHEEGGKRSFNVAFLLLLERFLLFLTTLPFFQFQRRNDINFCISHFYNFYPMILFFSLDLLFFNGYSSVVLRWGTSVSPRVYRHRPITICDDRLKLHTMSIAWSHLV